MIERWFYDWLGGHRKRHHAFPLPEPDSDDGAEVYESWIAAFRHRGIMDEGVATEASRRLVGETIRFPREHFPRLVEVAVGIYRERQPVASASNDPGSDRKAAETASRDCPECQGSGVAIRHRRLSLGTADSEGRPRTPHILLYCRCPLGRWFEAAHRKTAPDVRRRMYDLAEHPWLWGDEYREPPRDGEPVTTRAEDAPF